MERDIQFLNSGEFKAAARADQARDKVGLRKQFIPIAKEIDREKRQIRFVISTDTVDRDGDKVSPDGWMLDNYRKNPVVLWAHDSRQPPVAVARNVQIEGGKLVSLAEFPSRETYEFADTVFRLYAEGFMNATSVGFIPHEYKIIDDEDRSYGYDFLKQELIEYSCVPVPSNPDALIQARSKGINMAPLEEWAEKVLDGQHKILIPRKDLEALYKAAGGNKTSARVKKDENPVGAKTPVLMDGEAHIFEAHPGAAKITNVCDGDLSLMPAGDCKTLEDLKQAEVKPGYFATCTAKGLIRVGKQTDDLHCDVLAIEPDVDTAPEDDPIDETETVEEAVNDPVDGETVEASATTISIKIENTDELRELVERLERAAGLLAGKNPEPLIEINIDEPDQAPETKSEPGLIEVDVADIVEIARKRVAERIAEMTGRLPG